MLTNLDFSFYNWNVITGFLLKGLYFSLFLTVVATLGGILFGTLLVWTIVVPIVLMVVGVIGVIRGALASTRGEYFRYPMTIRFLT